MSQSFINALLTPEEKSVQRIPNDHVYLTWDREKGVVYEFGKKSDDTIKREEKQLEKEALEQDEHYQMSLAVEEIERRRLSYRATDIAEYGYDKYTEEFYYEPETESDEEKDDIVYDNA